MIRVYFEKTGYAELAAILPNEDMYMACLPALEKQAYKLGFSKITESETAEDINELREPEDKRPEHW